MMTSPSFSNQKVPRPFQLPWGQGNITEEVSIPRPHWEPTIQLLEFEDGSEVLRFCYYRNGRFGRGPLILSSQDMADLKRAGEQSTRIKLLLGSFA